MRVGLEKEGRGGVGSNHILIFLNSNSCAKVNIIRFNFVIEHFYDQLSTPQLLNSNSLLLKKLNSNSITPFERIQNFIHFLKIYSHFYLPITRKRRGARLGVADHLSTTLKWGNPV